jgi:glucose-6-phosphate isomerase
MANITLLPEWQALQDHQAEMADTHMRELFQRDPQRFQQFSFEAANLFLDYSKNRITTKTLDLLLRLADAVKLREQIEALFAGKPINQSEQRPALHMALRDPNHHPQIQSTLEKMANFAEQVRSGTWRGYSGQPISDIVNLGIGGSHLGPAMVVEALHAYADPRLRLHFVSNVDGATISQTLEYLNPATTLFIISSKSFSTIETLTNAQTAMQWLQQKAGNNVDLSHHFVAATERAEKATAFGIAATNIFPLWEWVGGRYSLWSAVGLPILLAIGNNNFQALLAGAHAMDQHFQTAAFKKNMPVIMGLLDVWYGNFWNAQARGVLPYADALKSLPAYLQQVHMESLGKQVTQSGEPIDYATGQIIFGQTGTDGQHSFHQLLHQGTALIPVDFVVPISQTLEKHQRILLANALAQSKALMEGRELEPHKTLPGNRPSNTLLLPQLNPSNLGALLALYEHKVFVESIVWQINAFDQWGVEIGKQLANTILPYLSHTNSVEELDSSTTGLIEQYRKYLK